MLTKKTVIGAFILLVLLAGAYWHLHVQRTMNAEPTKTYKAPETPHGHWHGDEWHSEPHPAPPPVSAEKQPANTATPEAEPVEAPRPVKSRTRAELDAENEAMEQEMRAFIAAPSNGDELREEAQALAAERLELIEKLRKHGLTPAIIDEMNDLAKRGGALSKKVSKRQRELDEESQRLAELDAARSRERWQQMSPAQRRAEQRARAEDYERRRKLLREDN